MISCSSRRGLGERLLGAPRQLLAPGALVERLAQQLQVQAQRVERIADLVREALAEAVHGLGAVAHAALLGGPRTRRDVLERQHAAESRAPGVSLDEIEAVIDEELERFRSEGPARARGGARCQWHRHLVLARRAGADPARRSS